MTEGERFREVRKSMGLTLAQVGETLGIKHSAVSKIELGYNPPSETTRLMFCKAFHVSRHWLQTGEGEMFEDVPETRESRLQQVFEEYSLSDGDKVIVREFLELSHEDRQAVLRYAEAVARGMVKTGIVSKETPEQRRERLHRELDRQLDEEEASSASSLGA